MKFSKEIINLSRHFKIHKLGRVYRLYTSDGRLFLEPHLRQPVLDRLHNQGAHSGFNALYTDFRRYFYMEHARDTLMLYIRDCSICRKVKQSKDLIHKPPPSNIPKFYMWSIGFVQMDPYNGYHHIITAVDYRTRYGHVQAIKGKMDAKFVEKFLEGIFQIHGEPCVIRSDRGPPFSSLEIRSWVEHHKFKWIMTAAYNPAGNGLCEAFNKSMINILKLMCLQAQHKDWPSIVADAKYIYNARHHTSIRMSP